MVFETDSRMKLTLSPYAHTQAKLLYHDETERGWEDRTHYHWNLQYSSNSMCMRLVY